MIVAKILFGSEKNEEIERLEKLLKAHPMASEFNFIRSEETLYEIPPKGICKGIAITELCRQLVIDAKNVVAIGD